MSYLQPLAFSRKRRLRKKHHLKEFTRYGIDLRIDIREGAPFTEDSFWDQVIGAIEAVELSFGGAIGPDDVGGYSAEGYVTKHQGRRMVSCTEADVEALKRAVCLRLHGIFTIKATLVAEREYRA